MVGRIVIQCGALWHPWVRPRVRSNMRINSYQVAFGMSTCLAAALLLGGRPFSTGAGPAIQAAPATAASLASLAEKGSGLEPAEEVAARRRAIEDLLPLMRSLQARGDSVRLARLARSVLTVWSELDSLQAVPALDGELRKWVENWAAAPLATSLQDPDGGSEP